MIVTDVGRVALAARVFTIAALTSLAALAGPEYLDGALLVALTAAVATALSLTPAALGDRRWRPWRAAWSRP